MTTLLNTIGELKTSTKKVETIQEVSDKYGHYEDIVATSSTQQDWQSDFAGRAAYLAKFGAHPKKAMYYSSDKEKQCRDNSCSSENETAVPTEPKVITDQVSNDTGSTNLSLSPQKSLGSADIPVADKSAAKLAEAAFTWPVPTLELIESLSLSDWKVVDLETTALTQFSDPVKDTPARRKLGCNLTPRARIVSLFWMENSQVQHFAWDLDTLNHDMSVMIANACLTKTFIGHNATFDLNWLRKLAANGQDENLLPGEHYAYPHPERVIDTLLFARLWAPAKAVNFIQRYYDKPGWGLDDLCLQFLRKKLDKTYQKPHNWVLPAPLSGEHYSYAASDTKELYNLVGTMLSQIVPGFIFSYGDDILPAFDSWLNQQGELAQMYLNYPVQLSDMHLKGMPLNGSAVKTYVERAINISEEQVGKLIEMEPELLPFKDRLVDFNKGVNDDLKNVLAAAFARRGLTVKRTEKSNSPKVGEKDLRGAGATQNPESRALFAELVKLNKTQKSAAMALKLGDFRKRSPVGRVHSLFSPTTATARLSSSEPNAQQFPGEELFRALVTSRPDSLPFGSEQENEANTPTRIVSCDFSALDVRVAAALAIREQAGLFEAFENGNLPSLFPDEIAEQLRILFNSFQIKAYDLGSSGQPDYLAAYNFYDEVLPSEESTEKDRAQSYKNAKQDGSWGAYNNCKNRHTANKFLRVFFSLWFMAKEKGTELPGTSLKTYGALREAFQLGIDIHTYTALKMDGIDVAEELSSVKPEDMPAQMAKYKEMLGGKRKVGKVANLSLLYGMQVQSFIDFASSAWDMHLSYEEGKRISDTWYEIYSEIKLWALATEMKGQPILDSASRKIRLKYGEDKGKTATAFFTSTLSDRPILGLGLNAGLNYQDQGTGADILVITMDILKRKYPEVLNCIINQVHDELVMECLPELEEEYTLKLQSAMNEAGDKLLKPFDVPMASDFVGGTVWIKD